MNKEQLDNLLAATIQSDGELSDLLFVAGRPMQMDSHGELRPFVHELSQPQLAGDYIEKLARIILNDSPRLLQDLKEHGSCDCGYTLRNACRFRVNVYMQDGNFAVVMRHLKPVIPTFEALSLGPVFREIITEQNGIIFVTGRTGMGKTTSIAAMLNEINKTRCVHILTLEDPIEFVLTPIKATFSQRELGRDFFNFHKGMRAAMREAPKIIFIGEIRDRETMEIVLTAGETGHLIFCTLHTINAAMTVNRIVGLFAPDEEAQVRERLAGSMRYIVSQRLVPAIAGGRRLVTEILGSNIRSREAITQRESDGRRFDDIIEASSPPGLAYV